MKVNVVYIFQKMDSLYFSNGVYPIKNCPNALCEISEFCVPYLVLMAVCLYSQNVEKSAKYYIFVFEKGVIGGGGHYVSSFQKIEHHIWS